MNVFVSTANKADEIRLYGYTNLRTIVIGLFQSEVESVTFIRGFSIIFAIHFMKNTFTITLISTYFALH